MVRQMVPPERLLDYKLGGGWEPLFEILRRPRPEVEFPRLQKIRTPKLQSRVGQAWEVVVAP